jgi:hypothetical protein
MQSVRRSPLNAANPARDCVMRSRLLLSVLLLAVSGCAHLNVGRLREDLSWTQRDSYAEATWQLINVVDALQTAQISDTPGVVEANPITRSILGAEPSGTDTAIYFATLGASHFAISRLLPARWRPYWHRSTITIGSVNALRNCTEYNLLCDD